jgi:hypothetical protein
MSDYLSDKMDRITKGIVNVCFGLVVMAAVLGFAVAIFTLAHRLVHWLDGVPLT